MKLDEAIRQAQRDPDMARSVAEFMRFSLGLTYEQSYRMACKAIPNLDRPAFDEMMQEADHA